MIVPPAWLELPWKRRAVVKRAESRCLRYRRMRTHAEGGSDAGAAWLQLLSEHPSALFELSHLSPAVLDERMTSSRRVLQELRAGAPLPGEAPSIPAARALALAAGDLEWVLREVRFLERLRRRLARNGTSWAERVTAAYIDSNRPDPIDPLRPQEVEHVLRLRRSARMGAFISWAEGRSRARGLRRYLRSEGPARVLVGRLAELPEGSPVRADMDGMPVVVVRLGSDVWAMEGICPHRGGDLSAGQIRAGAIECPIHGWCFDLADGREREGRGRGLRKVRVELSGDQVFLVQN